VPVVFGRLQASAPRARLTITASASSDRKSLAAFFIADGAGTRRYTRVAVKDRAGGGRARRPVLRRHRAMPRFLASPQFVSSKGCSREVGIGTGWDADIGSWADSDILRCFVIGRNFFRRHERFLAILAPL
jgi:hypothetical protein